MSSLTENYFIDDVTELGYEAMRAPGSGTRANHEAGDIWVVASERDLTRVWIVEEKYKSNDQKTIFEDGEKLDSMIEFAEKINAIPLMACRWSTRQEWSPGAFHIVRDARLVSRTKSDNFSMQPQRAIDNGFVSLDKYFNNRYGTYF